MSDGPHRSLPLRRHWKEVAERAAKSAFSPAEVQEALPYALKRDILEAPVKDIRDIMTTRSLFPETRVEELEALRHSCHGSAAANRAINCAIEAILSGLTGDAAVHFALKSALEDTAQDSMRGIEEHYQREASSWSAKYVRSRLNEARRNLDCGAIAEEILSSSKPQSRRSISLPQRSGVDEGPPL